MELVECIPNVSEGRNQEVINALANAISATEGVQLLHVDSGYDANRTVFTFVGDVESVYEAALALYEKAFELIDMRKQKGTHPRMGAVDVCPFVPLKDCTSNTLIDMVMRLAYELSDSFGICGYYYEYSAVYYDRVNLATIRKGEYEALPQKFELMPPDFGTYTNWPNFGSTVIGVRKLLVAYNVNLDTKDVSFAKKIAQNLRTSGNGIHKLAAAKAIGWYIKDFDRVQVSFNLTDLTKTGLIDAFNACKSEAHRLSCEVTGSELVGLVPESEFIKAYAHIKNTTPQNTLTIDQEELVIDYLGLREIKEFNSNLNIIERLTKTSTTV